MGAMKLGSTKARDRFPRLLHLISNFPTVQESFANLVNEIPSWMFIRWISQMVGLLNESESKIIVPILNRIAEEYPQALYYPFKISSETLCEKSQQLCSKITQLLHDPLLEEFISAL